MTPQEIRALQETAQRLGVNPQDILAVMQMESGVNPSAYNEKGGATGLIQFMPKTAQGLGTTTEALRGMSITEQLPFVEQYFKRAGLPKGATAGQIYGATFLPARVDREVLTERGESFYDANSALDLNNDGRIARQELDARAAEGMNRVRNRPEFSAFFQGGLGNQNRPQSAAAMSQQMIDQEVQKDIDGRPLRVTVQGGQRGLMDRDGLANIIREDMRQSPSQYPAGLLANEGIQDPNNMRAGPVIDGSSTTQENPAAYEVAKAAAVDNPEAALDSLGAEKPESKFNLAGIGNALVDIGAGIALLEGDTKTAHALQAMSKSNRQRESANKQRDAAIGLFTTYGISKENAGYIVDSGLANPILSSMMKSDADTRTSAMKNFEFLAEKVGTSRALEMSFGKGGTNINVSTGAPKVGKVPQGYQMTYDPETQQYNMQAIPGSEAAQKASEAESKKAEAVGQAERAANVVLQDIKRVREMASEGLPVTGIVGAATSMIPGTEAFDASKLLTTIKANIGFDRLQQMRDASPTGGALGQVSERELDTLQSVLGSLDQSQSEEQFLSNLKRMEDIYTEILRKAAAYPDAGKYGFGQSSPAQSQPGISVGQPY